MRTLKAHALHRGIGKTVTKNIKREFPGNDASLFVVCLQNEIRSSLVLSMLKQMLGDDKTEEVRESVVRSLALLMAFIDEPDKFPQVTPPPHLVTTQGISGLTQRKGHADTNSVFSSVTPVVL